MKTIIIMKNKMFKDLDGNIPGGEGKLIGGILRVGVFLLGVFLIPYTFIFLDV